MRGSVASFHFLCFSFKLSLLFFAWTDPMLNFIHRASIPPTTLDCCRELETRFFTEVQHYWCPAGLWHLLTLGICIHLLCALFTVQQTLSAALWWPLYTTHHVRSCMTGLWEKSSGHTVTSWHSHLLPTSVQRQHGSMDWFNHQQKLEVFFAFANKMTPAWEIRLHAKEPRNLLQVWGFFFT